MPSAQRGRSAVFTKLVKPRHRAGFTEQEDGSCRRWNILSPPRRGLPRSLGEHLKQRSGDGQDIRIIHLGKWNRNKRLVFAHPLLAERSQLQRIAGQRDSREMFNRYHESTPKDRQTRISRSAPDQETSGQKRSSKPHHSRPSTPSSVCAHRRCPRHPHPLHSPPTLINTSQCNAMKSFPFSISAPNMPS